MPQKRRPIKKKKMKAKTDRRSNAPHSRHGESDGDPINGSSSGYESVTTEAKIETDKRPNATKQAKIQIDKAAAMVEPATVAEYLSQPFESSPEKESHKVKDSGFKTPPFVDPVSPVDQVDQSLVEVASQLNNNTKIQDKDDLVVAETRSEHTVINETDSNDNQLSKENEVQKLGTKSNKASPISVEDLLRDSTNGKCQYCGRSSDDRVNEPVTPECSERQPLLASVPQPSDKASWKNCCGIFELFSGSSRN